MATETLLPDITSVLCEGLNPEQQAAVLAPANTALKVLAGAGTGKTEVITRRFAKLAIDLAQTQDTVDVTHRLWVSTFTEKAASEMKTRISDYLIRLTGQPLHPQAWIGTFHGLCQRILCEQSHHLPHLERYTLISDVEWDMFREDLMEQLLLEPDPLSKLLQEGAFKVAASQTKAYDTLALDEDNTEALLSEILSSIIPRLKASGLSPQAFYTQAMAQTDQFAQLLERLPNGDFGTIWQEHHEYARHWRQHLDVIAHPRFSFLPTDWTLECGAQKAFRQQKDPPDALSLLKEALRPFYKTQCWVTYNGRKKQAPFSPPTIDFSALNRCVAEEKLLISIVSSLYALYQKTLRMQKACDFEDLIQESVALLEQNAEVRREYQAHFAHYLVDEFQDSNAGQLKLIQLLCPQGDPKITVVGDTKQSIYGFRFAQPENLSLLFTGMPKTQQLTLKTNYRSETPILAVANRITEMLMPEQPEFLEAPSSAANIQPAPVTWFWQEDAASIGEAKEIEVDWISQTIQALVSTEEASPQDIAVLVKDHTKAMHVEATLESLGIPAIRQRNIGFFDTPVIQQGVALMELVEDPGQDFALINLLQRKLTHRELYLLARLRQQFREEMDLKDFSYYETLFRLYHEPQRMPRELLPTLGLLKFLVTQIETLHTDRNNHSPQLMFHWILKTFPLLTPEERQTFEGKKAYKQLELLKRVIYYWVDHAQKTLSFADILERVRRSQAKNDLNLPMEDSDITENAVRIMTIHGAKGLQFPVVFLAGTDTHRDTGWEGRLTVDPQYSGKLGFGLFLNRFEDEKTLKKLVYDTVWQIPRNQEEQLRLFYVAVTRAQKRLFISSWPKSLSWVNPAFFKDLPVTIVQDVHAPSPAND